MTKEEKYKVNKEFKEVRENIAFFSRYMTYISPKLSLWQTYKQKKEYFQQQLKELKKKYPEFVE